MIVNKKPIQQRQQQPQLPAIENSKASRKSSSGGGAARGHTKAAASKQASRLPTVSKASANQNAKAKHDQQPTSTSQKSQAHAVNVAPNTQHESLTCKAQLLLSQAADDASSGSIKIKFNHYNKQFPVHNGVLKWSDVDEEYAFSFVYRGNYGRDISACEVSVLGNKASNVGTPLVKDEGGNYFFDLCKDQQYIVCVTEDPIAGAGVEGFGSSRPLYAHSSAATGCESVTSGNNATKLLTKDLLAVAPTNLNSQQAKDLIERRDIEDILYSK
jgi:hypothetical protein